jgi:hypothetical protein
MNSVQQGATYAFSFTVDGDPTLDCNIAVMQYPGDTPAVSRAIALTNSAFAGALTSAETASLGVGQWFIHVRLTDTDEDVRAPEKLYVTKGWV